MKPRLLAAVAVLSLVTGCGVQPTGAVPAGPAPTLRNTIQTTSPAGVVLYFVADGQVIPVERPMAGPVSPETALVMLAKGPTADESAQGFTTFVPSWTGSVGISQSDPISLQLPYNARELSGQAVNQLVCTVEAAVTRSGTRWTTPGVRITGPDGDTYVQSCKPG